MHTRLGGVALAAVLAATGAATSVQAADLLIVEPAQKYHAPSDLRIYALLYGGYVAHSTTNWTMDTPVVLDVDVDTQHGFGAGGALGVRVVEGVSVEFDVFHTRRGFENPNVNPDVVLATTSAMVNVKGSVAVSDMIDLYAGVGVGGIHLLMTDGSNSASGWGAGYQAMIGASANVTENIAIFGELRHQNAFAPITTSDSVTSVDISLGGTNAILAGIKVSM